jgi:hypothetical protein
MNTNADDHHVLHIFVDHFQRESTRANIGHEHARRRETNFQLSDVVNIEQISTTELVIGQHWSTFEEIHRESNRCR